MKRLPENPEIAETRHSDVIYYYNDVKYRREASMRPTCGCLFFYISLGLVRGCEIEISHMGKNNGNLDLVCEKRLFSLG